MAFFIDVIFVFTYFYPPLPLPHLDQGNSYPRKYFKLIISDKYFMNVKIQRQILLQTWCNITLNTFYLTVR